MMATGAVIIAVLILMAGRSIEPPGRPIVLPSQVLQSPGDAVEACLDAPATTPSDSATVGRATLCHHRARVRVSLQASNLTPGETCAVLLTYIAHPAVCPDALCRSVYLTDERVLGLSLRIDGVVVSPSQVVELHTELPTSHLPAGAQLSLQVIHPSVQASSPA